MSTAAAAERARESRRQEEPSWLLVAGSGHLLAADRMRGSRLERQRLADFCFAPFGGAAAAAGQTGT